MNIPHNSARTSQAGARIRGFTLIELIVAMAVFSILLLVMLRFFNSAQTVWTKTNQRSYMFENAGIAMDIISKDLQCALYDSDNNYYSLWTDPADASKIYFITSSPFRPDYCTSSVTEVQYRLNGNTLERSVIGNMSDETTVNNQYDYIAHRREEYDVGGGGAFDGNTDRWEQIFSKTGLDDDFDFEELIPHVLSLQFILFDQNGAPYDPIVLDLELDNIRPPFPASIYVEMELLDRDTFQKALQIADSNSDGVLSVAELAASTAATNIVVNNKRKFSQIIYLPVSTGKM